VGPFSGWTGGWPIFAPLVFAKGGIRSSVPSFSFWRCALLRAGVGQSGRIFFQFFPASELAGYCHMSLAGIWSEEKGYRRSRINSFLLAEGKSINADFTSA
jgi:hypothetical protein